MGAAEIATNTTGQVTREPNSARQDVRVKVPLTVAFDDVFTRVDDISVGGFSISEITSERQIGERIKVGLAIPFRDFECTIVTTAEIVHVDRGKHALGCTFVDLTDSQIKLIQQVVRAFLTGAYVTVDDFLVSQTELTTSRSTQSAGGTDAAERMRDAVWRAIRYGILALAGLVLLGLVSLSFYFAFFTLEADLAAVSGRAVIMTAPVEGRVTAVGVSKGGVVEPGDVLFRLYDPTLVVYLARARGELAVAEARLAGLHDRFAERSTFSSIYRSLGLEELADLRQIQRQMVEAEATINAASAYTDALFNQELQLAVRSPCACLVASAVAANDLWVRRGDILVELVDPNDIVIEALVPSDRANRLKVAERANIALVDRPDTVSGRIISIDHVPDPAPRAGLPAAAEDRAEFASVLIVPDSPIRGANVGLPVQVSFPLNWRSALFPLGGFLE